MKRIQLLKVLDMDEDEQLLWVCSEVLKDPFDPKAGSRVVHVAELAFKLRDKVKGSEGADAWVKASQVVFAHIHPEYSNNVYSVAAYFADKAKPIHWIIAALIAKDNNA